MIYYNGSSDSGQLRSKGAVFNIPVSAEDYSSKDVLKVKSSTNYERGSKSYKAFDYSTYINDSSPFKKFHQITLYLGNNILTANLPQNITYKIANKYAQPLQWAANASLNWLAQSFSGELKSWGINGVGSMIPRASTAWIWTGTDPLTLSFTIDVMDDTQSNSNVNFQECLQVLGNYALAENGGMMYTNTPYSANLSISYKDNETNKTKSFGGGSGKAVSVLIGGMLYCQNMTLKSFQVQYNNTKNMLLHDYSMVGKGGARLLPMTAKLTIELQTVEAVTASNFTKMIMMSSDNPDGETQLSGNFNADITGLRNFVNGAIESVSDLF